MKQVIYRILEGTNCQVDPTPQIRHRLYDFFSIVFVIVSVQEQNGKAAMTQPTPCPGQRLCKHDSRRYYLATADAEPWMQGDLQLYSTTRRNRCNC